MEKFDCAVGQVYRLLTQSISTAQVDKVERKGVGERKKHE